MKLFLVKGIIDEPGRNVFGYDCSHGFVIRAKDEDEARKLASLEAGDEGAEVWFDKVQDKL